MAEALPCSVSASKVRPPFRIGRSWLGKTLVYCFGIIDDRFSCYGHLNSWGPEWWFRWGYSNRFGT